MSGREGAWRSRWAAIGAAVAVCLGGGVVHFAAAAGAGAPSAFVAVTPCRLFDTRSGADNVGPRTVPLRADDTFTAQVTGTNGRCTIPSTATGVALNVTIANPTASSFLTVFPADATRPLASNLNWTATSSPTPNQVTVLLSATGAASFSNTAGSVDVIADVVGYYTPATGSGGPSIDVSSADLVDDGPMLSLTGPTSVVSLSGGGGRVVLTAPGRLVATAAVMLTNTGDIGSGSVGRCVLLASPGDVRLGVQQTARMVDFMRDANLSLVGSAAVPAGSYDVEVRCDQLDAIVDGVARVDSASLVVQAVPD